MTEIDHSQPQGAIAAREHAAGADEPDARQHSTLADDPDSFGRTGEPGERALPGKPYVKPLRLAILVALFGALALWGGVPAIVLVAGILVMIFFHELGHYVMARRSGMKVTEFMIGFGPRIFSWRRGDVEYGVKAIPAGAYVKIIGMANVEEVPAGDEQQTYRQKGYWARMGVAVAGSTMHFIMAIVLIWFSFVFMGDVTDATHWAVDTIAPDSAASAAGVKLGDRVTKVGDVAVSTHDEMAKQAQKHPGETIPVTVERDGRRLTLTANITPRFVVYGTNRSEFQVYGNQDGGLSISLAQHSPLEKTGLRDGDVITAVNGTEVTSAAQLRKLLAAKPVASTGAATLSVRHTDGRAATARIDLGNALAMDRSEGFFGVGQEIVPEKMSPLAAVPASFEWFGSTTARSVVAMGHFFTPSSLGDFAARAFSTAPGKSDDDTKAQTNEAAAKAELKADSNRIVSIVGAVIMGTELADGGWGQLLAFFAFLNMAIGILNLIPLPPFDGGHVAIGTYEKIRELFRGDGKRYFADYNKVMPVAVAVVSFMLVVGLMAMYLDLADPIRV